MRVLFPLPCAIALLTAACSSAPEMLAPVPVAPPAGFHVVDGFLRDLDGRALILRGMNLSGGHKQAPYFDFHLLPDYQRVRDAWGMNAIRFLITWAAVEPQEGVFDDAYLDQVALRMDWARQAGLFVVLDMHQDVYGEGFASGGGDGAPRWTCDASHYAAFVPNPSEWFLNDLSPEVIACYDHLWNTPAMRGHYEEAWRRVAKRLADYDDVIVGFDPMNEPYWGSYSIVNFEADVLQPFYEEIVPVVRAERPRWVAFTEPSSSRNLDIPTGLTRMSFADVVYAPHSYDRDAESGMGFDPTHRGPVMANLAALAVEAKSLDAALWVGEYGGVASAPGIVPYMTAQYDGVSAVAGGSMYWDYSMGGGYSVLDADGAERKDLMGALVRPWPERVAGTPASFAFDATTSTFTLTYAPDAKVTAPTEISVPSRVYPNGYQVTCGGCATERTDGVLRVTTAPRGATAVVTITP